MTHSQGRPSSALLNFLTEAESLRVEERFEVIWQRGQELDEHNASSHYLTGLAAQQLGLLAEANTHYQSALRVNNDSGLRLDILTSAAEVLPPGQAVFALSQAIELADPQRQSELLEWKAELQLEQNSWSRAAESLREALALNPRNVHAREFLEEVLIREGRHEEARELLRTSEGLSSVELFRKSWLNNPKERLRPLKDCSPVLHPLYGTAALGNIKIVTRGPFPDGLLQDLADFHRREFGGELQFEVQSTASPLETFEELRDLIDVGGTPSWLQGPELHLVSATAGKSNPYTAGIGTPRLLVLKFAKGDPFQSTVAAHELYHSLLDLNHTNGTEGPDDPGSVMGPWGLRTPLSATYISEFHRECCTTTELIQSLVDEGKWEEALELDPKYLGLYDKVAKERLSKGDADGAVELLKRWVKQDPGPEAMAQLGELLLQLERDPSMILRDCRGVGVAANTHLYLGQCYLNCFSFEGALTQLRQAEQLEPENLHVLGMLGWALHGAGDFQEAAGYYQRALERSPGWESVKGRLKWVNGERYTAPDGDEELLWLESLTADDPEDILPKLKRATKAKLLLQRGALHFRNGQEPEAIQDFQRAVVARPFSLEARAAKAWLTYLGGQEQLARKDAEKILAMWAGEPACHYLLKMLDS